MKQRFKNQGTFIKYLVSYVIVFSLPILFILFYFYPQSSKIIRQHAIDNADRMLSQSINNINLQMKNIWSYPDAIHNNESLNIQLFMEENSINTYFIMREMRKILGYNSFVDKAFLYNKKTGTFYSFPGSFSNEEFSREGSTFYYPYWNKEDLLNELDLLNNVAIKSAERVHLKGGWSQSFDAITIMMPVPYQNIYSYAVLMLVIPEERLFPYSDESHQIVMLNGENQILAASNGKSNINSIELEEIMMNEQGKFIDEITISGEKYLVNVKESSLYNMTFISLTSLKDVLRDINQLKLITALIVFVIILIETIIILLFMRTNYAPIRKLRERAMATVGPVSIAGMNEFDLVSYAFDNLQSENKELVSKVMLNKNISREYFLIQYLNGILEKNDELIQQAADHGVHLLDHVCCLTFYASDRNIIQLLASLKELVDLSGRENGYCYIVKGLRHEDFILILSFSNEEMMKPYLYELYELGDQIKVGIGTTESVDMLANSYTLSLTALETAIFSTNHIVGYEDIDIKNTDDLRQLFEILRAMELTITRNDVRQFNEQLEILINLMKTKVRGLFILRIIYINAHNLLVKVLNKHGQNKEFCYGLSEKELNLSHLEGKLRAMGNELTDTMMQSIDQSELDIKDVLEYINNNFSDPNISLQSLADEFDMSYSNFSHFFKKQAGENFTSYIEEMRINKAKQLLKETTHTIKTIAEEVGYISANSFSRSFKKLENMAPGEYRKIQREI